MKSYTIFKITLTAAFCVAPTSANINTGLVIVIVVRVVCAWNRAALVAVWLRLLFVGIQFVWPHRCCRRSHIEIVCEKCAQINNTRVDFGVVAIPCISNRPSSEFVRNLHNFRFDVCFRCEFVVRRKFFFLFFFWLNSSLWTKCHVAVEFSRWLISMNFIWKPPRSSRSDLRVAAIAITASSTSQLLERSMPVIMKTFQIDCVEALKRWFVIILSIAFNYRYCSDEATRYRASSTQWRIFD